ncbi:MAG: diguanylate cyclase [Nitrospirota bacterium]
MSSATSAQGFSIRELIDASPAIISVIDTDRWEVRYQNQSGRQLMGQLDGKTCYQHIPKQPARCGFCRALEALRTGKATSSEVPMPNGQWLLVQWSPIRSKDSRLLAVETITDITDSKQREQEYRELKDRFEALASLDPLTGLLNRRGWMDKVERIVGRAAHDADALSVLLADIDHFKLINDSWGHAVGDQVLKTLGTLLLQQFRPTDVIGRWGGEEFIILLSPSVQELRDIAERVREAVAVSPFLREGGAETVPVTISIGGATVVPSCGGRRELEELIQMADRMLYLAKQSGRNQVCLR